MSLDNLCTTDIEETKPTEMTICDITAITNMDYLIRYYVVLYTTILTIVK